MTITYNEIILLMDKVFKEGSIRSSSVIIVINSKLNCWRFAPLRNSVILVFKISVGANTFDSFEASTFDSKMAKYERTSAIFVLYVKQDILIRKYSALEIFLVRY